MQRIQTWTVAWNIAKDRPLSGAGFSFESLPDDRRWLSYADPELLKYLSYSRAAHSIYFQILGQHGFVAFGLYLTLILSTVWKLNQIRKRAAGDPQLAWIANYASAISICLLGYMVSGAFVSTGYFDLAWVYYTSTGILARELPALTPSTWRRSMPRKAVDAMPDIKEVQGPVTPEIGPARGRNAGI